MGTLGSLVTALAVAAAAERPPASGPAEVRQRVDDAVVEVVGNSNHAGFLVGSTHVVWAGHCARGERRDGLQVRFKDGRQLPARLVAERPEFDLALLEIPSDHGHTPLELAARGADVKPNELLVHGGHPAGYTFVFALGRFIGPTRLRGWATPLLRVATFSVPGDSGGPLVCGEGRVHGVLVAASHTGTEAFAVPAEAVRALLSDLRGKPEDAPAEDAPPVPGKKGLDVAEARPTPGEKGLDGGARVEAPPGGASPDSAAPPAAPQDALREQQPGPKGPVPRASAVKAVLFGASWCHACKGALAWLQSHGVATLEEPLERLPKVRNRSGKPLGEAIPVIVLQGRRGRRVLEGFSVDALEAAVRELR